MKEENISFWQLLAIGLMLFAMFLGAGNIIFAPVLGQLAGTNTWNGMAGFLITGVGFVLLAIIALAMAGGTVEKLAGRVHPLFGKYFSIALFLSLGPIYVIPRTTSVVYEIAIIPSIPGNVSAGSILLFVFSLIFIVLTVVLSINPSKFVDILGKVLTPVFAILLAVFVLMSFLSPMGSFHEPQEPYMTGAFFKGFVEGYYTMDVLAAFVFGGIFIKSIRGLGVKSEKSTAKIFIKAGIITIIGLALLQLSLAWVGATSVDAIGYLDNGGQVLAESAKSLFGFGGIYILGSVVLLTGVTTNIACLSSVAEYFARIYPKVSYRAWLYALALISLVITNFGLSTILELASPILLLLYPISITLIILVFTNKLFKGYQSVYVGAVTGTGIVALLDAMKDAHILTDTINTTFRFIPLFESGAGWLITGFIGAIIGLVYAKVKHQSPREFLVTNE